MADRIYPITGIVSMRGVEQQRVAVYERRGDKDGRIALDLDNYSYAILTPEEARELAKSLINTAHLADGRTTTLTVPEPNFVRVNETATLPLEHPLVIGISAVAGNLRQLARNKRDSYAVIAAVDVDNQADALELLVRTWCHG